MSEVDFVFRDDPQLPNSLAVQVWPFFRDAIRRSVSSGDRRDAISEQWKYLLRIEPNATPEMYVEAWQLGSKELQFDHNWHDMIHKIPTSKRRHVLEQLVAKCSERMQKLTGQRQTNMKYEIDRLKRELENAKRPERPGAGIIDRLSGYVSDPGSRIQVMTGAFHLDRDQPFVQSLVESSDDREKIWAIEAIRLFPTKKNRERLNLLAKDANESVREAATQLAKELDEIAAKPPEPRQRKVRQKAEGRIKGHG